MTLKMSPQIDQLAKAFAAFQGESENISKDGKNPHFKSKYTTLAAMLEETRPILAKHGLSFLQVPGNTGDSILIESLLMHSSGQWIMGDLLMTPKDKFPQAAGSAISYGRRYAGMAILNLAGDDDDGEAANGRKKDNSEQETETGPQIASVAKTEIKANEPVNVPQVEIFSAKNNDHFKRLYRFCEKAGYPEKSEAFAKQMDGKPIAQASHEWEIFKAQDLPLIEVNNA